MAEASPPPRRRFEVQPVETTVKKSRKFAVEPVETTTRSNKKPGIHPVEETPARKDTVPPKRRFIPEPVETSHKSNKRDVNPLPTPELTPVPKTPPPTDTPKPRRKFTPELIETSKRSKKAGDRAPATLPTDKTDITPGTNHIYAEKKRRTRPLVPPTPPANTPNDELTLADLSRLPLMPPRRQGSMRPHPNTRRSTRQLSFQPELEPIVSETSSAGSNNSDEEEDEEESDDEYTPSLSGSLGSSEDSLQKLQLARTRESCDDRFSGYLLALAAKAAEKQLREQALAAFPNSDFHEIVEHFYNHEPENGSDEEGVEGVGMLADPERQITEVGWAAKEMQAHQDKLNQLREDETHKRVAAEAAAPSFRDPFWTNGMTEKNTAFARAGMNPMDKQKEAELERMRNAASPPMLGGDLKFRMCPSPKATKLESDQRHDIHPNRTEDGGGLWGGYCIAEEDGEYLSPAGHQAPPMIHTPNCERDDPFATAFSNEVPPSRPISKGSKGVHMVAGIDERLKSEITKSKLEEALQREFDEKFVTQVYNYLSLGYPALARPYDAELAKISGISEEELRKDDHNKNAKGHIGAPDKAKVDGKDDYCSRWKALRLYILEWARQHPGFGNSAVGPNAWGVRARRGSWAI
ncbi:hypothetical protein BP5796_08939 [Coleophoma crateriformis]|uniref:Uncharacterized protein n=1 Tax=Coleophoma crateriformis TaxID=565419 RepID=A0A3D8R2K2_9HELO|nr:hypothetical protein BP5796_08939 [Coleophoma crateriformis]